MSELQVAVVTAGKIPWTKGCCRRCGVGHDPRRESEMCAFCEIISRYEEGEEPAWQDSALKAASVIVDIERKAFPEHDKRGY